MPRTKVSQSPRGGSPIWLFGVLLVGLTVTVWLFLVQSPTSLLRMNRETVAGGVKPLSGQAFPGSSSRPDGAPASNEELTGTGDEAPVLIAGSFAVAPVGEVERLPTIVCRVLVGPQGTVEDAKIFHSRPELAEFEDIALQAVRGFRFQAGSRAGRATPTWVKVPVPFRSADPTLHRVVRIKGSDTIGGALGPALAKAYERAQRGAEIRIEALGSSTAFVGLFDGSAEIGAASRRVSEKESRQAAELGLELHEFAIGYDGVAIITHPENPVTELSLAQAGAIFRGEKLRWSDFGGNERLIRVLSRPSYSGTHQFFRERVLGGDDADETNSFGRRTEFIEKNADILTAVAADPYAIAYVGLGWVDESVRTIGVVGEQGQAIAPSKATVADGSYPIFRPLLFYSRGAPNDETLSFIRFVFSEEGQAIVESEGLVGADVPQNLPDGSARPVIAVTLDPAGGAPDVMRVYFEVNEIKVGNEDEAELARAAKLLLAGQHHAMITGGSDSTGGAQENSFIARRRAESVRDHLLGLGVDAAALQVDSGGMAHPIASNDSVEGRQANRRVDIFVVPNGEAEAYAN